MYSPLNQYKHFQHYGYILEGMFPEIYRKKYELSGKCPHAVKMLILIQCGYLVMIKVATEGII